MVEARPTTPTQNAAIDRAVNKVLDETHTPGVSDSTLPTLKSHRPSGLRGRFAALMTVPALVLAACGVGDKPPATPTLPTNTPGATQSFEPSPSTQASPSFEVTPPPPSQTPDVSPSIAPSPSIAEVSKQTILAEKPVKTSAQNVIDAIKAAYKSDTAMHIGTLNDWISFFQDDCENNNGQATNPNANRLEGCISFVDGLENVAKGSQNAKTWNAVRYGVFYAETNLPKPYNTLFKQQV